MWCSVLSRFGLSLMLDLVSSTPWILISLIFPFVSTFHLPSMSFSWFTSPWFLLRSLREDPWMCGGLWKQWLPYYMIWLSLFWILNLGFDFYFSMITESFILSPWFWVNLPVLFRPWKLSPSILSFFVSLLFKMLF